MFKKIIDFLSGKSAKEERIKLYQQVRKDIENFKVKNKRI